MSDKNEAYQGGGDLFIRSARPVTFWRCVWVVFIWLMYSTGCVLTGYCTKSEFSLSSRLDTAPQHYSLSDAHYVYKKRPLPVLKEEEEGVSEESIDEQPATPEEPEINADLRARVKQALADIDRQ